VTWRGKQKSDEKKNYPEYFVNPVKDKNTLDSLYSSAFWITWANRIQLIVITAFIKHPG